MTVHKESAGGIVVNARGEIALVKNGPHFWGFPKGHIDPGEDALTAAKREIEEETGLKELSLVRQLETYSRYKGMGVTDDDRSEVKTIHMFHFTTSEETLAPQDEGNPEAKWFMPDDVEAALTIPKDAEYFRAVRALL